MMLIFSQVFVYYCFTSLHVDAVSSEGADQPLVHKRDQFPCSNCEIRAILLDLKERISRIEQALIPSKTVGKNCADLRKRGFKTDGVYKIDPDGLGSFSVRCDMTTSGGGWTIFQRRLDGSVDFFRGWKAYKNGFGDLKGEFWLGLDKIHRLTKAKKNVLRVDLQDSSGNTRYALYDYFAVSSGKNKYQLSLGTYTGTAGDSLSLHKGQPFSTKDADNDSYKGNCAAAYKGAWWYASCHHSNLNGHYYLGSHKSYADGVNWYTWKGYHYSLKKTEMKIRPLGFH